MFAYASVLIELGYFEGIDINFLIVGHTHSSIDQYFSVLSKSIKLLNLSDLQSAFKLSAAKHTEIVVVRQ